MRGKPPSQKKKKNGTQVQMSKLLCSFVFYRSSTWLLASVESLLKCPIAEFSLDSELISISIPQDLGKYMVHQAEPLYLARLNTTGRSPGIPKCAVKDRLTQCHLSLRHDTHTIEMGIVFLGLLLYIRYVMRSRPALVGCGSLWRLTTSIGVVPHR